MRPRTRAELDGCLDTIRAAPRGRGRLEKIVRRPHDGEREVVEEGTLDEERGLVGDNWQTRGSRSTPDEKAHPGRQLTLMGARVIEAIVGGREGWEPAGDQLFVDLDLSAGSLPASTRLAIGEAVIEVSPEPHTGCRKFVDRFGLDAMKFVNDRGLRELNLRGINARVVRGGTIRAGDEIVVLQPGTAAAGGSRT